MNRICVLAIAALSLPFAMEAAAQAAEPAAGAAATTKPAATTSAPAAAPKAAPAPQRTGAATTAPAAQKTAATTAAPLNTAGMSQQDKMRYCNKEATGKKGAERKAFMKTCLSARKPA